MTEYVKNSDIFAVVKRKEEISYQLKHESGDRDPVQDQQLKGHLSLLPRLHLFVSSVVVLHVDRRSSRRDWQVLTGYVPFSEREFSATI